MNADTFQDALYHEKIEALTRHPDQHTQATALAAWQIYAGRVTDLLAAGEPTTHNQILAWRLVQVAGICERLALDLELPDPTITERP